jgi:hypothetical protein
MRGRTRFTAVATLAVAASALATSVFAVPRTTQDVAGSVPLRVALHWSGRPVPCAQGVPPTVVCHAHPSGYSAVAGVGFVSQHYVYPVETVPSACPGGFTVLPYTARLIVADKGDILVALGGVDACLEGPPADTVLSPTQAFIVTGGSGVFAGATGSGVVSRANIRREATGNGAGTDVWEGTVVATSFELDLTPPTITGARPLVVRAPRKATRVPVRYRVAATDDVDGAVPVACQPRSGSRLKVGRRTLVRCSATDRSANTTRASFTVTVRRR